MEQHPYGEKILDRYEPPSGATGLTFRERVYKDVYIPKLKGLISREDRYFIFRVNSGSYDYWSSVNQEEMCGGYAAHMGYWHYATEEERDAEFTRLLSQGFDETSKESER